MYTFTEKNGSTTVIFDWSISSAGWTVSYITFHAYGGGAIIGEASSFNWTPGVNYNQVLVDADQLTKALKEN